MELLPNVAYFNSTMVRLKGGVRQKPILLKLFQFHYGTIKRFALLFTISQNSISIPLWYD